MNLNLIRSREQVLLGGVCGGLAAYLGVRPFVIRLLFVTLAFGHGIGLLLYGLLWVILPVDGRLRRPLAQRAGEGFYETALPADDFSSLLNEPTTQLKILAGSALILAGLISVLPDLAGPGLEWLKFDLLWPVILIFSGLALLIRHPKGVEPYDYPTRS
ncbi:MAG: PspC domain-containing protein [Anaerolineales bacterium]|nr:PspC domain-containing protein [Anaerolineales bacterium]